MDSIDRELFDCEKASFDEELFFDGKFFEKIISKSTLTETTAVCKKCVSSYSEVKGSRRSTTNFLNHLQSKHGKDSVAEFRLHYRKRKGEIPKVTGSVVRSSGSRRYTQDAFNEDIVKFFCSAKIPLSCIDNPYFATIFEKLNIQNSGLTLTSRRTLGRKLKQFYNKHVIEIKEILERVEFVCTTVDIWSCRARSYLGVTAHWIDPITYRRQSRAIACQRLSGKLTSQRIAEILQGIHSDFGLQQTKVVATVTDNASDFVEAFSTFGVHPECISRSGELSSEGSDYEDPLVSDSEENITNYEIDQIRLPYHLRCCSQILSLIATADLEIVFNSNPELYSLHISTIEKCNNLWKKGSKAKSSQLVQNILGHNLPRPGATRWTSLYDAMKQIFDVKGKNNDLHKALGLSHPFSDNEFKYMEEYLTCLKPVADALDILQGENNTYYGLLLPTIVVLRKKLLTLQETALLYCEPMARVLLSSVERRFESFLSFSSPNAERAVIAALSYPRFKNKWFACIETVDLPPIENLFINILSNEFESVRNATNDLSMKNRKSEEEEFFNFDAPLNDDNPLIGDPRRQAELAIADYFENECRTPELFNRYPEIKKIFLKYNTPLPSLAAVERLYSFATLANNPKFNRLSDKTLERRIIIKANQNYEKKAVT